MIKFCPNCGEGLDKVVNFCPNCGYKIKGSEETASTPERTSFEKIICQVCGEENSPDSGVCESCGAKLKNSDYSRNKIPLKSDKNRFNKEITSKKQNQNKHAVKKSPEKLETGKIVTIIGASVAAVFIILLLSGVFDTPSKVSNQVQTGGEGQSSQVNLQSIQRINELEEQLKADPKNSELLLELAHLRNDSGFNEKAIENYMQYLEIHPENADARVDMGVCYYKLQRYDEAKSAMEKALEYKPDHQIAHLNLGIVNLAAGNLEKSREWLRKAVQINPNSDYAKEAQRLLESHTQ